LLEPNRRIAFQFRALTIATLLIAWFMGASASEVISIRQAVPDGAARIHITGETGKNIIIKAVEDLGELRPNMVIINESSAEQLVTLPGISRKTADRIILEREHRIFYDWRDLQDRIKGLGASKIESLQELGVRLNR